MSYNSTYSTDDLSPIAIDSAGKIGVAIGSISIIFVILIAIGLFFYITKRR